MSRRKCWVQFRRRYWGGSRRRSRSVASGSPTRLLGSSSSWRATRPASSPGPPWRSTAGSSWPDPPPDDQGMPDMPRFMIVTRSRSLPNKAGVLLGYHPELVLELIVQRADNNEEDCEMLYAELEM